MTTDPTAREIPADELASAERFLRSKAKWAHHLSEREALVTVMAEYDRRGAVEQAAAAYVLAGLCGNDQADQSAKLAALIEAVRTNRNFHG